MTATTYTFHRAEDHAILATAQPDTLQETARSIAASIAPTHDTTRRVYVHNGLGVVAAGTCRAGIWTDTLRDNYRPFDAKARAVREAIGLHEA